MKSKMLLMMLGCIAMIVSCSDSPKSNQPIEILKKPELRTALPDDTLAYIRMPNIWSSFNASGDSFRKIQGHAKHVEQFEKIRTAFADKMSQSIPAPYNDLAELFLTKLDAPIELAVVPHKQGLPAPQLLIQTHLDIKSYQEFDEQIIKKIPSQPGFMVSPTPNKQGVGAIAALMVQGQYEFETSGLLKIVIGTNVNSEAIQTYFTQPNTKNPMLALEKQVDTASNQGLFVYAAIEKIIQDFQGMLPPQSLETIQSLGLEQTKSLAFGYGTGNGKGRIKVLIDTPQAGWREFLPVINHDSTGSLKASGDIKSAAKLAMPSYEWLSLFIQKASSGKNSIQELEQKFYELSQTNLKDWFDSLGSEMVYINDEKAEYIALQLQDSAKFKDLLSKVAQREEGMDYKVKSYSRGEIVHLTLDSLIKLYDEQSPSTSPELQIYIDLIKDLKSHLFMMVDGEYLLISSVPQPLLARLKNKPQTSVKDWLKNQQQVNWNETMLSITGQYNNAANQYYYTYLSLLMAMADASSATDFDIYAFPTLDELGVPKKGGYGFTVNMGENILSAELVYDVSPIEYLAEMYQSGSIAVVGILAAVALPAYRDYILESKVSSMQNTGFTIKSQIEIGYLETGELFGATTIETAQLSTLQSPYELDFDEQRNTFTITSPSDSELTGKYISYTAHLIDGGVNWECKTNIDSKSLYRECDRGY